MNVRHAPRYVGKMEVNSSATLDPSTKSDVEQTSELGHVSSQDLGFRLLSSNIVDSRIEGAR
jgi:hypothetical protein